MPLNRSRRRVRAALAVVAVVAFTPLLAPDARAQTKRNLGGGVVTGKVIFDAGAPPPITSGGGCSEDLRFHLEDTTAPSVVFNTVITGFVGGIHITGTGESLVCGIGSQNFGALQLTIDGLGPTGSRVSCPTLDGGYSRVGATVIVSVSGECIVNSFGTGTVSFQGAFTLTPTPLGAGITSPVNQAEVHGPFAIFPAES